MKQKSILYFLSLVSILAIISCSQGDQDYDDYTSRVEYSENIRSTEFLEDSLITVLTWNIKLAFGHRGNPWSDDIGGRHDLVDSLAQLIRSYDPHVVLLQEVPYDRENTIIKRVLDSIAYKLNFNYAFGGHGFNSDGSYPTRAQWGNAILSKFEIASIENREVFNLNDVWSRRSVLKAALRFKQNEILDSYSLHYSTNARSDAEFRTQVSKTRSFYEESQNPVILGGDFNYSNSIDTILNLINCSPPEYSDIDRIYSSEDFITINPYSRIEHSLEFSDHFAGIVTLKIKG